MKRNVSTLIASATIATALSAVLVASPASAGPISAIQGNKTCGPGTTLEIKSSSTNTGGGTFLVYHDTFSSPGTANRTSYKQWTTPGAHSNYTGQAVGNPWRITVNNGTLDTYSAPCANIS